MNKGRKVAPVTLGSILTTVLIVIGVVCCFIFKPVRITRLMDNMNKVTGDYHTYVNDLFLFIDENRLGGTWVAMDKSNEHWRLDSNHTGETWDVSQDVQEGEGTKYNWAVKGKQLLLDFCGEMGQHVYYDYTFTDQNDTSFTWKDLYGNSRTFIKK